MRIIGLVALSAIAMVLTVANRPILAEDGLLGNHVFLLGCALVLAIPAFVALAWLGRGLVPKRVLFLAALTGYGPATAVVVVSAALYLPSTPASSVIELVVRNAVVPPIVEELSKALATAILLALFVDRASLARRHGALVGGAVGLGFLVGEAAWYATLAVSGDSVFNAWGQLVIRFGLLGLSGHTLITALAGVGVAELLAARTVPGQRATRIGRAIPWFIGAVGLHALHNSVGALLQSAVVQALAVRELADMTPVTLPVAWVGALVSTVIVQGWAWIVLGLRGLDPRPITGGRAAEPHAAAPGSGGEDTMVESRRME